MVPPALAVTVDGAPFARVAAPDPIAPRAWILGVVSLRVSVREGRIAAQVRAHRTGDDAPSVLALGPRAMVHVALGEARLPDVAPVILDRAARIDVFLDGAPVGAATLDHPARDARAFAHVYCRWLRDGACEPGWDLTDFLSLPPGAKYERLVSGTLDAGRVVTLAFAAVP